MKSKLRPFIQKAIADGVFSAASVLVSYRGDLLLKEAFGTHSIENKKEVTLSSFFDIASLTKPIATASLVQLAIQENKIKLDQKLSEFWNTENLKEVSLQNLLQHNSGLIDWRPYYKNFKTYQGSQTALKEEFKKILLNEKLLYKTQEKVIYSDLGYILLGFLLEEIYEEDLNKIFKNKISTPLNLEKTFYNRISNKEVSDPQNFVATENCSWRHKTLCGEVMDDNCYVLDGVAGHAGLFSTVEDIFLYLQELQKGLEGKSLVFDKKITEDFLQVPKNRNRSQRYFTLGFDTPSEPSSSGQYFSNSSVGHLGYSGCSFWWDIKKQMIVILLSNRVYPDRHNKKILSWRPQFHDFIVENIKN